MTVYIVSDLHIHGPEDPLYEALLVLLRTRLQSGDTLVLAGDIFDVFLGTSRFFVARYAEFMKAVREATGRGARIHYIEGNHDFHLAPLSATGLAVSRHDVRLDLKGRRFYIAHGDTANPRDYSYRVLRWAFRSLPMRLFATVLPGRFWDWVGRTSSRYSRGRKPALAAQLPPGRMAALRNIYRSFAAERAVEGFDFVVLGHCHDLDEMDFTVQGKAAQYINVGYPRVHGSVLSWTEGDDKVRREKF